MIDAHMLDRLRTGTPGLSAGVHLNHAGASLMPAEALAAIHQHLAFESRVGPMEAALLVAPQRDSVRRDAASLLNADQDEIALMGSASSAFGACFASMPMLQKGDRILVGRQEWGGNLASYYRAAQRAGARVELIPSRQDGGVDPAALAACLDHRVRLISLTWLPANGGLINDAAAIGAVAKAARIPYLIDAGQALGQLPIDVRALQCDVLIGACRKHLRGPRGTALLYIRRAYLAQLEPVWVDVSSAPFNDGRFAMRADARRFETSEAPVALQLGLGASIALALTLGPLNIAAQVAQTARALRERIAELRGITLRDLGQPANQSALVSFSVAGHAADSVKSALAKSNIYVSANGVPFTPLDMQARGLDSVVRASVSYLNTTEDVDKLVAALERLPA